MANNDWKARIGMVYSTNPEFGYQADSNDSSIETPPPSRQKLFVGIDRRNRGGKQVTLVTGFVGTEEDLIALGKLLKTKCGAGGTAKNGEIIIQGDFRDKIVTTLQSLGYQAKRGN